MVTNAQAPLLDVRLSVVRAIIGQWLIIAMLLIGCVAAAATFAVGEIERLITLAIATGAAMWGAAIVLVRRACRLIVSSEHVQWSQGVLWRRHAHVRLDRIRMVTITQGPIDRLLVVGTLAVWTSGDVPEIMVIGVGSPQDVRGIIEHGQRTSEKDPDEATGGPTKAEDARNTVERDKLKENE